MAAGHKRSNRQNSAARRHSLHRKVELSRCAASQIIRIDPGLQGTAVSWTYSTTIAVHEKHQSFIHYKQIQ